MGNPVKWFADKTGGALVGFILGQLLSPGILAATAILGASIMTYVITHVVIAVFVLQGIVLAFQWSVELRRRRKETRDVSLEILSLESVYWSRGSLSIFLRLRVENVQMRRKYVNSMEAILVEPWRLRRVPTEGRTLVVWQDADQERGGGVFRKEIQDIGIEPHTRDNFWLLFFEIPVRMEIQIWCSRDKMWGLRAAWRSRNRA